MTSVKKAFDSGAIPASQSEHLSYAEKLFGIQRYSSLLSGDNKNPHRRIFARSSLNSPIRLSRVGLFPVQYYNRPGAKTSSRCGLERSWPDIKTEVFQSVVSCIMKGRFSCSVHYSDINCVKQKMVF